MSRYISLAPLRKLIQNNCTLQIAKDVPLKVQSELETYITTIVIQGEKRASYAGRKTILPRDIETQNISLESNQLANNEIKRLIKDVTKMRISSKLPMIIGISGEQFVLDLIAEAERLCIADRRKRIQRKDILAAFADYYMKMNKNKILR